MPLCHLCLCAHRSHLTSHSCVRLGSGMLCCGNLGSSVALRSFSRVGSSTVNGPARLGACSRFQCQTSFTWGLTLSVFSVSWLAQSLSVTDFSVFGPPCLFGALELLFRSSVWFASEGHFHCLFGLYSFRELSLSQRLSVLWLVLPLFSSTVSSSFAEFRSSG